MNFSKYFDWFKNGAEWRGVRSKTHTYAIWLDGREELYDLKRDPDALQNLVFEKRYRSLTLRMRAATISELRRTDAKMVEHLPTVGTGY